MHLLAITDLHLSDEGEYALLLPNGRISAIKIALSGAKAFAGAEGLYGVVTLDGAVAL